MATGSSTGLQTICMKTNSGGKPSFMFVLPRDQKPFQCGLCSVAFDINRDLVVHVKAHLLTKPFQCGYCKISYETNIELTAHVRTHRLFLCVPQENVSTSQNVVDLGVKRGSQSSISELKIEGQRWITLADKWKAAAAEVPGQDTDRNEIMVKDIEEASPLQSQATGFDKIMSKGLESESLAMDAQNQELTTSISMMGLRIMKPGADIQTLVVKVQEDAASRGSEAFIDASHPCADSSKSDALESLEMMVEDAYSNDDYCTIDDNKKCPGAESDMSPSGNQDSTLKQLPASRLMTILARKSVVTRTSSSSTDFIIPSIKQEQKSLENQEANGSKSCCEDEENLLDNSTLENSTEQRTLGTLGKDTASVTDISICAEPTPSDPSYSEHRPTEVSDDNSVHCPKTNQQHQHRDCEKDGAHRPFVCSLCGDSFEDAKLVGHHFRSVHRRGKDQAFLSFSDSDIEKKTASSGGDHNRHCHCYSASKLLECYVCEEIFQGRHDLSDHILTVHSKSDLRVFECGVCGRKFKMAHHLKDHFVARHGNRSSSCHVCSLKFNPIHYFQQQPNSCSTGGLLPASEASPGICKQSRSTLVDNPLDSSEMAAQVADDSDAVCDNDRKDRCLSVVGGEKRSVSASSNEGVTLEQQSKRPQGRPPGSLQMTGTALLCGNVRNNSLKQEQDIFQSFEETVTKSGCEGAEKVLASSPIRSSTDQRTLAQDRSSDMDEVASAEPASVDACHSNCTPSKWTKTSSVSPSKKNHYNQDTTCVKAFRPFVCCVCGSSFEDPNHVSVHIQRIHRKGRKQEPLLFATSTHLSDDRQTGSHGDDVDRTSQSSGTSDHFKCEVCDRVFKHRHHLRRHTLVVHYESELRLFQCGVCGHKFKLAQHLRYHFEAYHGNGRFRPHRCPKCGKTFTLLHHQKQHILSCPSSGVSPSLSDDPDEFSHGDTEDSSLSAVKSEYGFTTKYKNKAGKKQLTICHICGKIAYGFTRLQAHILAMHSDLRPYQCKLCTRAFKSKNSYSTHMKTHTKEKPFMCDICGRSFATIGTFKCHRHTHTNARPYKCEICQKGFNSYSGLGSHRLRHKEDKRYSCDICGKKFYTSNLLKRHIVTHTDLRPLSCKKCGKTYRSSSSLKYHMTHVHPK